MLFIVSFKDQWHHIYGFDLSWWLTVRVLLMMLQNVMTSEVLHNHLEATYITVDSVRFFGVKQTPSLVLVNSQGVPFTYKENQVSREMIGCHLTHHINI